MRFGLATTETTPPFPTTMAGYAGRRDSFDGVNDPLVFTALVLEEGGRRALLGSVDLCSFPGEPTRALLDRLAEAAGCPRDNVMLNASHTHGGPASSTDRYREWFFEQIVAAVGQAAANMAEGSLSYGEGKTTLPMNRRIERDGKVTNAPNPDGPVDDRLQLLVLRNAGGEIVAVGMKASCHPVSTAAQHLITADYPGAWRAEFSRAFGPSVTPFFLQGAGADARPRHVADGPQWRRMKHAELEVIGRDLMAEMLQILAGGQPRPLGDLMLAGKINPVTAPCEPTYARREDLEPLLARGGLYREYAEKCLKRLDAGEPVPDHDTYHVQTLWLDSELALIGLDAEPLCGLGRTVEAAVAPAQGMLLGYVNGSTGYVPDTFEMKRGGYETMSFYYRGWCGPLKPGLEHLFAAAVLPRPDADRR